MTGMWKANSERWVCWPDTKINPSCITGECSDCTKAPYRRKMKYSEALTLGNKMGIEVKLINRGMLWRPVVKRSVPARG